MKTLNVGAQESDVKSLNSAFYVPPKSSQNLEKCWGTAHAKFTSDLHPVPFQTSLTYGTFHVSCKDPPVWQITALWLLEICDLESVIQRKAF